MLLRCVIIVYFFLIGENVWIIAGSFRYICDHTNREFKLGELVYINIISQKLVIRTKSVEFMPFYLSFSTFLMSISFFLYGLLSDDAFIYVRVFSSHFFLKY